MNTHKQIINKITEQIIGCAYTVHNKLGYGFLEKIYENALVYELRKSGLKVETQKAVKVIYDGIIIGDHIIDLLVEDIVIVEIKTVRELCDMHTAQCLNYLKAMRLKYCLLLNFGTKVNVKRYINDLR